MKQNTSKTTMPHYRQGDVLLVPVANIPANRVKTNRVTLAFGEVTGHHHTISNGAVGYAANPTDLAEYVEVTADTADLTHQEHDTITLPKGTYRSVRQVEYAPGELKNVAD